MKWLFLGDILFVFQSELQMGVALPNVSIFAFSFDEVESFQDVDNVVDPPPFNLK